VFLSEKLVFLELQKTGSSHIVALLEKTIEGRVIGKHEPPSRQVFAQPRTFVGSIRNPWEWYVSLWAYGCDKRGALYERVTKAPKGVTRSIRRKIRKKVSEFRVWLRDPYYYTFQALNNRYRNPDEWRLSYADPDDPKAFRAWLRMIHGSRHRHDFADDYGNYPMSSFAGLLTYRYLRLFCRNDFADVQTAAELQEFERKNCYIDYFIRNENLEGDFFTALDTAGVTISEEKRNLVHAARKTNTSSKKHPAAYYYDEETIDLVRDRERLLIEKFGYAAPERMPAARAARA
jgi:hypothetical protein